MPAEVVRSKNAKKTLYFSDYLKTNKCSIVWSRRRTQSGYLDMHSCLDMSCFQSYICHDVQNAYAGKPLTCNWGERRQHGFAGDRRDLILHFPSSQRKEKSTELRHADQPLSPKRSNKAGGYRDKAEENQHEQRSIGAVQK